MKRSTLYMLAVVAGLLIAIWYVFGRTPSANPGNLPGQDESNGTGAF